MPYRSPVRTPLTIPASMADKPEPSFWQKLAAQFKGAQASDMPDKDLPYNQQKASAFVKGFTGRK